MVVLLWLCRQFSGCDGYIFGLLWVFLLWLRVFFLVVVVWWVCGCCGGVASNLVLVDYGQW